MNSFETDCVRAFRSPNFWIGFLLECLILCKAGPDSDLFPISVPLVVSLPYSTVWITDMESGYLKEYIPRCGKKAYIFGKIAACALSGGTLLAAAGWIYGKMLKDKAEILDIGLLFSSGMLWALCAATLAAVSKSRYVAYGGSFVLFYLLVIVKERYFTELYCIDPEEWILPKHTWVFDHGGILILCGGLLIILAMIYYEILWRCIERV